MRYCACKILLSAIGPSNSCIIISACYQYQTTRPSIVYKSVYNPMWLNFDSAKAKESSAASDEPAPVPKPQQQSEEASGGVMSKISDLIPFNPTQDDDGDDDDWE